jgi:tetratricopeptide (TPR) repeat protein
MRRIICAALLLCAAIAPAAFAQQRTQQLLTNGVEVSLIDNGTKLSFTNNNTRNTDLDLVVYYADGTSALKTYTVRPFRYYQDGGYYVDPNNIHIQRPGRYVSAPMYSNLDRRATAISLPTAAQMTAFKNQREAEARAKAAEDARRRVEREAEEKRQAEANRIAAEKARQEEAARVAAENARKEAVTFNASGEAAAAAGNADKALADFTRAIQLDSNLAPAYAGRGMQYYNRRDWDRAIADFTEAVRLDPKNATAFNNRGAAYNNKGDWDRAIADFTEAVRIDPNYAAPYRHRGYAYMQKGNYAQARADCNKALQINPNYQNAKDLDAELKKRGY